MYNDTFVETFLKIVLGVTAVILLLSRFNIMLLKGESKMNTKLFETICAFIDNYGEYIKYILISIPVLIFFWFLSLIAYGLFGG